LLQFFDGASLVSAQGFWNSSLRAPFSQAASPNAMVKINSRGIIYSLRQLVSEGIPRFFNKTVKYPLPPVKLPIYKRLERQQVIEFCKTIMS
jgi:hypothetical protein